MGMRGIAGITLAKKLRRKRLKRRKPTAEHELALRVLKAVKSAAAGQLSVSSRQDDKDREEIEETHMQENGLQSMLENSSNQVNVNQIFASCKFHELGIAPTLSDHMHGRMGFAAPTRIQESVIPLILSGKDVLVKAETGSGKTVAYLAPIVHQLQASMKKVTRADGTLALVLVPTRELCLQVHEVMQQLVHRFHWLVPGYVMGGENRLKEKARLRKGINLLVGTPGRLLDHLQHTASFHHSNLRWLVLDEADRLLDLGLGKDIESILRIISSQPPSLSGDTSHHKREKRCQHVLLSATLNEQVNQLVCLSLLKPATVGLTESSTLSKDISGRELNVDSPQILEKANPTEYILPAHLAQGYIRVPCNLRLVVLLAMLRKRFDMHTSCKVVVFFSTCDAVDFHYALISEFQWNFGLNEKKDEAIGFLQCRSFRLHGNMSQQERTVTFHGFIREKSALLLCTDVAARGLDFPKVSCIIQYDSPGDAAEYVHRVGRTARLGQKGEALIFLQPCEIEYRQELRKHGVILMERKLENVLEDMFNGMKKQNHETEVSLEMNPGAMAFQRTLEAFIGKQGSLKYLATDAFRSYVRAYATHRGDLRRIFQVKKLHLGHVATSFGLREYPSLLGKSWNKQAKRKAKEELVVKRAKKNRRFQSAAVIE